MGVYIKGMKMPKLENNSAVKMEIRNLDGVVQIGIMTGGYSCCEQWAYYDPVEVPEKHSRLIDADALKKEFGDTNMDIYTDEVKKYIDDAPTVIESEGE